MAGPRRIAAACFGWSAILLIGAAAGAAVRPAEVKAGPLCPHEACDIGAGYCRPVDLNYTCTEKWPGECQSKICLGA